jgi:hypothetical protein
MPDVISIEEHDEAIAAQWDAAYKQGRQDLAHQVMAVVDGHLRDSGFGFILKGKLMALLLREGIKVDVGLDG